MKRNPLYGILHESLTNARIGKNMTQLQIANCLNRPQSFVSKYESGERRLDVIEFLMVCEILAIDPEAVIKELKIAANKST
ncbi:MAG: helix-turn-helix transcriptional regulator [Candidatus Symbiobacter sp.]|nr:helix-turn-helix transcriptional regulator [Candidatus Symbiobacter sp.]